MTLAPIALNGRFTGTLQPTGTQIAAFGLFDAIIREKRERPLVVFADSRFPGVSAWSSIPLTTLVETPFHDWSRYRAQMWEQVIFPRQSVKRKCVLAHHPITTCSVWQPVPTVVTLHDLNFYRHPQWYSRSFRLFYNIFAVPGMQRAKHVVTISDYVKGHAIRYLHIPEKKVSRIYNGVKPMSESSRRDGPPYILAVGSLQPHKNLPRMIRAHQQLRARHPNLELWVVGRPQPRFSKQPELAELLKAPGVKVLGYLSEAELGSAYRNARVFLYPSLEEGFGLPLLEAFLAGTLVVTSNVSCLPEVAGPASVLVDPLSEEAIARGVEEILHLSEAERAAKLAEGRAWAAKFTWKESACQYLKLYEELIA